MRRDLAEAVVTAAGQPTTTRIGTVTGITGPTGLPLLQITLSGAAEPLLPESIGVLNGYAPNVGDTVVLLGQAAVGAESSASTWLVMGVSSKASTNVWMARPVRYSDAALSTVTNVAFSATAGAPALPMAGVGFYAPASGRVRVHWGVELRQVANFILVSPQAATGLTLGAGTVLPGWAASFDRTRRTDPTGAMNAGNSDILDGLTPGQPYNVTLYHVVGGSTGEVNRRFVSVTPQE